jgi:ribonucleoside-diphosphate reductase alpha chain
MGGGIGYDFSTIRPRGSLIKKLNSNATGPISFMHIFDAVGLATCSSGHRRGAQMGILRVDHPDIEEFVHAKNNGDRLTGFNISVAVTDAFMAAVEQGASEFPLQFNGETYRTVNPGQLWDAIMRSAWDWAEPGVIFIDKINETNNLSYCETICATNPCSEQPLPAYGACLLGSFNLVKYIRPMSESSYRFDFDAFKKDILCVVRAMDRINDVARYPLQEQLHEALQKRRMGLGVTGVANALETLGFPYGKDDFIAFLHRVMGTLRDTAYYASAQLAEQLGTFPAFRKEYLDSPFIQSLGDTARQAIDRHGIRNSHLISIAPTGTISLCADNISSGIEPVFCVQESRTIHTLDGRKQFLVEDYAHANFNTVPRDAAKVTVDEHINVLCTVQMYTDSAVSKTCNVPPTMEWDEFKALYHRAWRRGAKGCTVFNIGGKRFGIRQAIEEPGCASGVCDV